MKTLFSMTARTILRMPRTRVLVGLLLVATLGHGCGRTPAAIPSETLPATATTQTTAAAVTPAFTLAPGIEPVPSRTALTSPAVVEVLDLGGPAIPGHNPLSLVSAGESVYVANEGSRNLSIVVNDRVSSVLSLEPGPYRLATDSQSRRVYVAAEASRTVYVLEQEQIADIWPLSLTPTALTVSQGTLWVGSADGTIVRLDATTGQLLARNPPVQDGMIVDLSAMENGQVVAATFSQLYLYDATGQNVVASRPYAGYRTMAVVGGDTVYVCAYDRATESTRVEELDGVTLAPVRALTVADDILAIGVDAGRDRLLVSGSISNRVRAIDLASGEIMASVAAGLSPQRLAYEPTDDRLYVTCFESDTLAAFSGADLDLLNMIPVALRATALTPAQNAEGVFVGLNTGTVRALTDEGESTALSRVGYPAALAWLPDGAGLAVLDRASSQVVLYGPEGTPFQASSVSSDPRALYVDMVTDNLYAGDTALSLSTGLTSTLRIPAGQSASPPIGLLRDTTRNTLYALALNGTPGSNGGYVVYRQEGSDWSAEHTPGRLSVIDIVYDRATDRFYSISGRMAEFGIQVYDAGTEQEQHYMPLSAPPVAMLLNSPCHHLWVATGMAATDAVPAYTTLTAYDTRIFSPVASVRINDIISVASVDPESGRLYLASAGDDLIYVVQDVMLPSPEPGAAPTSAPTPETASATKTASATPTISATQTPSPAPRTATPTPTVLPSCAIPVQADLLRAWASSGGRFGCPTGPAMRENWGWQPFENGTAFWRRDTQQVIVTLSSGAALSFKDGWSEGMPDQLCDATPPEGLWQPIRGFGLVWCEQAGVREGLGWATQPESAFLSTYQLFENGVLFTGHGQGAIWLDDQGTWIQTGL